MKRLSKEKKRTPPKKQHWFGDVERRELIPYLISSVRLEPLAWCIATYIYPRYRLVSPTQSGLLKIKRLDEVDLDSDNDEEIGEEERSGYWFECPIGNTKFLLFKVGGEGWRGKFLSYNLNVPSFGAVTRFVITINNDVDCTGIAWLSAEKEETDGTKKEEDEHIEVVFDEESLIRDHETDGRLRCCILTNLLQIRDLSSSARIIGVTTNNEFVCAFIEERSTEGLDFLTVSLQKDIWAPNDAHFIVLDLEVNLNSDT